MHYVSFDHGYVNANRQSSSFHLVKMSNPYNPQSQLSR